MNITTQVIDNKWIKLLDEFKSDNQSVFTRIYDEFYNLFSWKAYKRVKDDLAASCIAQDAFLMLWIHRKKISNKNELLDFLGRHINKGCNDFYCRAVGFYRSALRLDSIENYQTFMCGYTSAYNEDEPIETRGNTSLTPEKLAQWREVTQVLPSLNAQKQKFIKLCLTHAFNYKTMAQALGGITAYRMEKYVDQVLTELKDLIVNSKKLDCVPSRTRTLYEGILTDEQISIFRLRYEMNLCFDEIAEKLKLTKPHVQRTFVAACIQVKKRKKGIL